MHQSKPQTEEKNTAKSFNKQCFVTFPSSTSLATAFIAEPLGMNSPQRMFTPFCKPFNMQKYNWLKWSY